MTHPEDLKPGQWITPVACKRHVPSTAKTASGRAIWLHPEDVQFCGTPLLVVAISLPFVCVQDGPQRSTLDLRVWDVQVLGRRYVQAMLEADGECCQLPPTLGPGQCPQCGAKLIQRYASKDRNWRTVCPGCDYDGGAGGGC